MKKLLMALVAVFIVGCPNPETGKTDPWLTARVLIFQSKNAVPIAESIFMQWTFAQTDAEKVKKAQETFYKIKTAVLNGFALALDGVNIAQQAKEEPDVTKLLAQASLAWADLHKFLGDLLGDKEEPAAPADVVRSTTKALTTATSQPVQKTDSELLKAFKKLPKTLK